MSRTHSEYSGYSLGTLIDISKYRNTGHIRMALPQRKKKKKFCKKTGKLLAAVVASIIP